MVRSQAKASSLKDPISKIHSTHTKMIVGIWLFERSQRASVVIELVSLPSFFSFLVAWSFLSHIDCYLLQHGKALTKFEPVAARNSEPFIVKVSFLFLTTKKENRDDFKALCCMQ
jgi:hypothetical protein